MQHLSQSKILEIYQTSEGKKPFVDWLEDLDDKTRFRVKERLDRVSLGNLGDWKTVGKGVFELRLSFGSGYRIYYGQADKTIIILLSGGDKSKQKTDIKKAQVYWKDYLER